MGINDLYDSQTWVVGLDDNENLVALGMETGDTIVTQCNFAGGAAQNENSHWGAAWSFQNRAYFQRDNGDGVFRLNLEGRACVLTYASSSNVVSGDNDGISCLQDADPFAHREASKLL